MNRNEHGGTIMSSDWLVYNIVTHKVTNAFRINYVNIHCLSFKSTYLSLQQKLIF